MQSGCTVIECQSNNTEHTMKKKQTPSSRKGVPSKMKGRKMPPRAQIVRLARIASLLKRNSCPTAEKLLKEYRDIELIEGKTIRAKYSLRTVYRDIDLLRNDFECPIMFDKASKTYYLEDPKWEFNCPANLSESVMLALIVGGRIAEEVFPDPLRARIKKSVDELLKGNSPEFLEKTLVRSLKVFAEGGIAENPSVFSTVFEAWQFHRRLHIVYNDQSGTITERDIDPHVLFLYLHEWRIKTFCHLKNAQRTFVINRIVRAWLCPETFEPDNSIIDSVSLDTIVSYKKLKDVKIRLSGDAVKFAKANRMHSKQKIKQVGGEWLFTIPEIPGEVVVPWILSQQGQAVPLEPPELVERVRSSVQALSESMKETQ